MEAEEYVNGVIDENGKKVIRSLNDSEKEWLNKFLEETVNGSSKDQDDFYEDKRPFYNEDNARRRDIFNIANSLGQLSPISHTEFNLLVTSHTYEDVLIELLDQKMKKENWFGKSKILKKGKKS